MTHLQTGNHFIVQAFRLLFCQDGEVCHSYPEVVSFRVFEGSFGVEFRRGVSVSSESREGPFRIGARPVYSTQ